MQNCYFITFPRSGHHILLKLLDSFVEVNDHYCEYYQCVKADGQPINCPNSGYSLLDSYKKKHKCESGQRLIKSHDFNLDLEFDENKNYIFQLRNPILSIKSWYELESKIPANQHRNIDWRVFFDAKFIFWKSFTSKWITYLGQKNFKYIPYNSLSNYKELKSIADFLQLTYKQDNNWYPDIFLPQRNFVEDASGYLQAKEESVVDILNQLNIERIYK